jgi:phosphoribosylglycinamide formyltransferase-1
MATIQKVTVLISGRGSNLVALHENAQGYEISAVVTDNPNAPGAAWATERGIPTVTVLRHQFPNLAEFKKRVLEAVDGTEPALVALAGFMVVLQPEFVDAYAGRLINIHPSLLPKFPGLHTHQRALEAGEREHGATVHFVSAGVDTGPVIAQAKVALHPDDTPEVLAARTLTVEHKLYPWALRHLAAGDIRLTPSGVSYSDHVRSEAAAFGFSVGVC